MSTTHRPMAAYSTLLMAALAHVVGHLILHLLILAAGHTLVAALESLVLAAETHAGPWAPTAMLRTLYVTSLVLCLCTGMGRNGVNIWLYMVDMKGMLSVQNYVSLLSFRRSKYDHYWNCGSSHCNLLFLSSPM